MVDFLRGIKAGVITGIIYLVIYIVVGVISFYESLYLTDFLDAAGLAPVLSPVYPGFVSSFGIFSNIVRGIIFGVIFAVVYNFLPGTISVVKGVVLSSLFWMVTVIEVLYTMPEWSGVRGTYYGGTVVLSSVSLILIGIMFALLFGALTGLLWDRFRATRLAEARDGNPILLVGFILGAIIWVLFALMFPIEGVPLAVTGSEFWWERIVTRLVLFLGLPGWILALVAWRRTRRGESGLRLSVAGGAIMVLTGIMLMPGVISIVGGVLSRRKPTSKPSTAKIGQ